MSIFNRHKTGGLVPPNDERFEKVCGCSMKLPINEKRLFKYKDINFQMYLN